MNENTIFAEIEGDREQLEVGSWELEVGSREWEWEWGDNSGCG